MEQTAFFEKKINLTPKDLNKVHTTNIESILTTKASELIEEKCSEHGFVLPGSIKLLSRSMGYFESARFTGDAVYYVKLEGKVIYPADGVKVKGEVIRKNKMGLYVVYRNAIRIQVPRDLHLGSEEYESIQIGDTIEVELKRSKFQINDSYILASGIFVESSMANSIDIQSEGSKEDKTAMGKPVVNEGMEKVAEEEEDDDGDEEDNTDDNQTDE